MENKLDEDTELFIDALRGIAAFMVLATHALDLGIAGVFGWEISTNPQGWQWVRATLGHGGFWVWSFFVISGFCIHQSIARSGNGRPISWSKYALARVTRIYPLFLIGLLLAALTWFLTIHHIKPTEKFAWPQFGASLFMLHAFTDTFPCYDSSWSLSNEMIYYALWPAALIICRGSGNRAARFSMFGTLFVLTAIYILWKGLHRMQASTAVNGLWSLAVLYPLWIVGAWLVSNWPAMRDKVTQGWWLLCIPLCLVSMCALTYARLHGNSSGAMNAAGLTAIPGLLLLIAGGHQFRLSAKSWMKPVYRWLGRFSYPSYILHYQFMLLLDFYLLRNNGTTTIYNPLWRSASLLLITFVATALIGPPMERRIMAWRSGVLARARS